MGYLGWAIIEFVADVGGVEWLPAPVASLINPPPPRLPAIKEIVPQTHALPPATAGLLLEPSDQPAWRHPAAGRLASSQPLTLSQTIALPRAVRWQRPLIGQGTGTPLIVGENIFLTGSDADRRLWLWAVNSTNEDPLWQVELAQGDFPTRHAKTSDAASTPCSDGRRIYVAWAAEVKAFIAAFSTTGDRIWKTELGPFAAMHGFASSPALSHGLVLLNVDNGPQSFMVAVQAATGEILWRRRRPASGDGSYSSPIVFEQPNTTDSAQPATPATIVSGLEAIECRRLADGELLWQAGGIASVSAITPLIADGICLAGSGFPERVLLALKLDEFDEPEISETAGRVVATGPTPKLLWRETKSSEVPYVPSPVVKEGRLFLVHDDGLAHCRDLTTGNVLWKRRVGGSFTASPILIGNTMLCVSETGACSLLALKDGEILQRFQLPGGCFATPRLLADSLLFRTTENLMCIRLPVASVE